MLAILLIQNLIPMAVTVALALGIHFILGNTEKNIDSDEFEKEYTLKKFDKLNSSD